MLQLYEFVTPHEANKVHEYMADFMHKIKEAKHVDEFNIEVYLPEELKIKAKNKKGKFYKLLKSFFEKYKLLSAKNKHIVDNAFVSMNKIKELFAEKIDRVTIADLPETIRVESKQLFVYVYETILQSLGKIKDHYSSFLKIQDNMYCAFCGIEKFNHSDHWKQDYDHLLAKTIYPFAAINMKNLCPMCEKCNRVHKKKKDLIWENGLQIKAINPYLKYNKIKINFSGSKLFAQRNLNQWTIKFLPSSNEVVKWDNVFRIKERMVKDILSASGKRSDFGFWLLA